MSQVTDTKVIVRQLGEGNQYTDPSKLIVTGPTLEEYLRSFYRDGWTLFAASVVGGIGVTLTYSFVLVKYGTDAPSIK